MQPASYDRIGIGYREQRRPDPRIAHAIEAALGDASAVVNVGAGTGSYEPACTAAAVDVSRIMLGQRARDAAPAVQADAGALPFADGAFAASLAILTVHHWPDREAGLRELARVARRRVVVLTWDPRADDFWLTRDYFPQIAALDRGIFPALDELARALGPLSVRPVAVPHDCSDGFLGAYWRRPKAYLSSAVRAGMSTFDRIEGLEAGLARLRRDLHTGTWRRRNHDLLTRTWLDVGYRLVVAERTAPPR